MPTQPKDREDRVTGLFRALRDSDPDRVFDNHQLTNIIKKITQQLLIAQAEIAMLQQKLFELELREESLDL